MGAETARRRRKKTAIRGRIAMPEITLGREMIPGVPAFQEGTAPYLPGYGGYGEYNPLAWTITDVPEEREYINQVVAWAQVRYGTVNEQTFRQAQQDIALRGTLTGSTWEDFMGIGRGGGGPTGTDPALLQYYYAQLQLARDEFNYQQQLDAIEARLAQDRLYLDQLNVSAQWNLAAQQEQRIAQQEQQRIEIERQLAGIQQQRVSLDDRLGNMGYNVQQQRNMIDQMLGLGGLGVDVMGQQVTQRGQDVNAMLGQMGFDLQGRDQDIRQRWDDIQYMMFQQQMGADIRQQDINAAIAQLDATIRQRGQDVNLREQDINAVLSQIDLSIQAASQIGVTQRGQDIDALLAMGQQALTGAGLGVEMRGQDISAQIAHQQNLVNQFATEARMWADAGELGLAQDAERRMRAAMQQQAALQQGQLAIQGWGTGLQGMQGAGNIQAQLAQSLGQVEAQRAQMLSNLAAHPRDYMQYLYAIGGGQNFLSRLAAGLPLGAQSTGQIGGTATLGPGWEQLVGAVTARPDMPYYQTGTQMAQQLMGAAQNMPAIPSQQQILAMGQLPGLTPLAPQPTAPSLAAANAPQVSIPNTQFALPGQVATPSTSFTMPGWPAPVDTTVALPPAPGAQPLPPAVGPAPQMGPLPPAVGAPTFQTPQQPLGAGAELTPSQQQLFDEFRRVAPNVPLDVAMNIARNPDAFRSYVGGSPAMQRGGGLWVDEPMVAMGLRSGRPLFTASEPTRRYPSGIPELIQGVGGVQITPVNKLPSYQAGGTYSMRPAPLSEAEKWLPQEPRFDTLTPEGLTDSPALVPPGTGPTNGQGQPTININVGQEPQRYGGGVAGYGVGTPYGVQQPNVRGGGQPNVWYGPGAARRLAPAPTPYQPGLPSTDSPARVPPGSLPPGGTDSAALLPPGTTPGPAFDPLAVYQRMMRALTPRDYYRMSPTQRSLMESIISALGIPPEDAWWFKEASFPTAVDPSQIFFGNFSRGGLVPVR